MEQIIGVGFVVVGLPFEGNIAVCLYAVAGLNPEPEPFEKIYNEKWKVEPFELLTAVDMLVIDSSRAQLDVFGSKNNAEKGDC